MNVREISLTEITLMEGYRYQDLLPEDKKQIDLLRLIKERIERYDYTDEDVADESIVGKIKKDFAEKVKNEVLEKFENAILEVQICLAESKDE